MNPKELKELLTRCWSAETSADLSGWTPQNPAWGQCAVTALVVQDFFGGQIMRASLQEVAGYEHMRSHYWNVLPGGTKLDLTKGQFASNVYEQIPQGHERQRSVLIAYGTTLERFARLRLSIEGARNPNPFLLDADFKECFKAGQKSDCLKLRFGCIAKHKGRIVAHSANKRIAPLAHLCEIECIRKHITSRTNSMIGACGHAEEYALAELVRLNLPLSECTLYICGFAIDNTPSLRSESDFTCLRCAVQMFMHSVSGVYVPLVDTWAFLSAHEAVSKSEKYALASK